MKVLEEQIEEEFEDVKISIYIFWGTCTAYWTPDFIKILFDKHYQIIFFIALIR